MKVWVPLVLGLGASCGPTTMPPPPPQPTHPAPARQSWPETRRDATTDVIHGQTVADPYRWLEAGDDADVKAWAAAQDTYARAELARLTEIDRVRDRLKTLAYYDAMGAPVHRNGRYFTPRRYADKEQEVVSWRQGEDGEDHVLFDPNTWSTDGSVVLGLWVPSRDGTRVAYKVKANGADESATHVIDVDTGKELPDVIPGTRYSEASWAPDGKGFYYTWVPPLSAVPRKERAGHAELWFHRLGDDPAKDATVYPATGDSNTFLSGAVSADGHWLTVTIDHGWRSSDVYFKDLRKKGAAWKTLVSGVDATFSLGAWKDRFYLYTNLDAPMYRVLVADPAKPDRAAWRELVPERADAALQSVRVVGGHLSLAYLHDAESETEIRGLDGALVRKLAVPPHGTSDGVLGEPADDIGYVTYTSFTEPSVVYRTSIKSGELTELSRVVLPVDTAQFVTEQAWFTSKDGTRVPMFIVHKRGIEKTGKNPTILYGYGGYGISVTPQFGFSRPLWLEQGGVYALANLRGGGEYGESWHRAGSGVNKRHAVEDLIAAADYLVDAGWTSREHLGLIGASNGGLVVASAMTQAPDKFRAVVSMAPITDMVRYPLSGAGASWLTEYGSPDDPDQFAALYAYSPYHHVTAGVAYPALLVLSADSDDRVDPMHARKLTAAVQAATTSAAPVLLRIQAHSGHAGPDQVKEQIEEFAAITAFLSAELK